MCHGGVLSSLADRLVSKWTGEPVFLVDWCSSEMLTWWLVVTWLDCLMA